MKSLFLAFFLFFCSLSSFAQFYVWQDGKIVYSVTSGMPDSVSFALYTESSSDNTGDVVDLPQGQLPGQFSVSETRKVAFSMGNLQYNPKENKWRFAEHQYDIVGADNANISATFDGWIDLFGWGTSGWAESGASKFKPTDYVGRAYDYGPYKNSAAYSLVGDYSNADWGVFNPIENGGNEAGLWRTLTADEFNYVFTLRANAAQLYGVASVAGINGVILLPDDWTLPEGVSFNPGVATSYSAKNNISESDWQKFESAGAVFFPEAGIRNGSAFQFSVRAPSDGAYWSSTLADGTNSFAYAMSFCSDVVNAKTNSLSGSVRATANLGLSVRLVKILE